MNQPPYLLTQLIREFTAQLRATGVSSPSGAVRNYRAFLRGNLTDVIACVFPLFSREAGQARIGHLVAAFLAEHGAREAEFHHLATEFVRFIHGRDDLSSDECQLIEYEWILFYVEISPETLAVTTVSPADLQSNSGLTVRLNPTLHCVRLPFELSADGPVHREPAEAIFWGIFRNHRHEVMQKRLLSFDRTLLHLLLDQGLSTPGDLRQALPADDARQLNEWLISSQDIDLISLQQR